MQKQAFLRSEGDAWFERNREKLDKWLDDPVLRAIADLKLDYGDPSVLEIGCANGWRLQYMRENWDVALTVGVDPSPEAIKGAQGPKSVMVRGTADRLPADVRRLPADGRGYDVVIMGFCLYLVDREDLFKVAAEADSVLGEGGHLIVYDLYSDRPKAVPYKHAEGLHSYKMDHAILWSWNPAYTEIYRRIWWYGWPEWDDRHIVSVLRKDLKNPWPDS